MGLSEFLLGMIAMQVIFLLFHFILFQKREFLLLLLFAITVVASFMLIRYSQSRTLIKIVNSENILPVSFALIFISGGFYYCFTRHFLEAPLYHKTYNKILKLAEAILYFTGLIILCRVFFIDQFGLLIPFGKLIFFINSFIQVYIIVYIFYTRKTINLMLVLGTLFMAIFFKFVMLPFALNNFDVRDIQEQLEFILIGLTINLIFFIFTLIYKSRQSEKQKFALEIQKKEELELQRREISNDLHDDLGSVLSSLYVYSNITFKDFVSGGHKTNYYLQKLTVGIKSAMDNMGDVIWAVRNDETNEKAFSSRIKDFFIDVFDASNIECVYEIDQSTEKKLDGILTRKYLMLIAKEAINNAIKHSFASKIYVRLYSIGEQICLEIEDNGVGINQESVPQGNGLTSIKERVSRLQGNLSITKGIENGTKITCVVSPYN